MMTEVEKIVDGIKAIRYDLKRIGDDLKRIVDDQSKMELDDKHPDVQFDVSPSRHSLIIKVEHEWNGMSCHICSRGQHDSNDIINGCDLCVPGVRDNSYCALFIPNEGRVKTKRDIVGMMESHNQRWIRERSNFN